MATQKIQADFEHKFKKYVAWHEEVMVFGASLEEVQKAFDGMRFFHVEMFIALPGKHDELYKQRQMENAYLKELGRPQNLIFTHDQGAAWDAHRSRRARGRTRRGVDHRRPVQVPTGAL